MNRACPSDEELLQFDQGTLPPHRMDDLTRHVMDCDTCHDLLQGIDGNEQVVLASILKSGQVLAEEVEYAQARDKLLRMPEEVSSSELDDAESELSKDDLRTFASLSPKLGPYQILGELGRGGMGIVYRARHDILKRDTALKVLHPHRMRDVSVVERFYREMEAIGRLQDQHIVQAYDAGAADNIHFLAMEFVEGIDAGTCARDAPLTVPNACEIIRQAALGLETARLHNMVHRDIKPSNLMVGRDGQVKILDLGLAAFRREDAADGLEGYAVGTVDYMAPEQWQGSQEIDIRADIYSLGCALFRLLTGKPPFRDVPDDGISKLQAHLFQKPPSLRTMRPDVPRDLDALAQVMLAKEPDDRFATPAELAAAIAPFCKGSDLAGLAERFAVSHTAATLPAVSPASGTSAKIFHARRRRRWFTVGLMAGLLALLGGLFIQLRPDGSLVVTVEPPDATVMIGTRQLKTPPGELISIELPPGDHRFHISKPGFGAKSGTIQIARGRQATLDIELKPTSAGDPPSTPSGLLGTHEADVYCVDVSSDGNWAISGGADGTLRLWNLEQRREERVFRGHENVVEAVRFVPQHPTVVSAGRDRTVRAWDTQTGQEIGRYGDHAELVSCLDVSADGRHLLVGGAESDIKLFDMRTGKQQARLRGHRGTVRDVCFAPDERWALSCADDKVAILWDLGSGQIKNVLQGHRARILSIDVSHDGQYAVSASDDKTVRFWHIASEEQLRTMRWHDKPVRGVTFVGDSYVVASCGDDQAVRLWNPFSGTVLGVLEGHTARIRAVETHNHSAIVSVGDNHEVRIWEAPLTHPTPSPQEYVPTYSVHTIVGDTAKELAPLRKWDTQEHQLRSIAVSPQETTVATGGDAGVVKIWKLETGELHKQLQGSAAILCVAFSPNGKWLAASHKDGRVRVWETDHYTIVKTFRAHRGWIPKITFAPDSTRFVTGGFDGKVRIWNPARNWKPLRSRTFDQFWIQSVTLTKRFDNKKRPFFLPVFVSDAGTLVMWYYNRNRQIAQIGRPHRGMAMTCLDVAPHRRQVAAAGIGRSVRIWNINNRKPLHRLRGHQGTVRDVKWLADSQFLVSCGDDSTIRLWDLNGEHEINRGLGHEGPVRCLAIAPQRHVILSVGNDGTVCVWPGPPRS